MRLVNIRDIPKAKTSFYNYPQPMPIYHSSEEFTINVLNKAGDTKIFVADEPYMFFKIIRDIFGEVPHYNNLIPERSIPEGYEVWFKTIDTFVPDICEIDGTVIPKFDAEGNLIPTDACYIRVYAFVPTMHLFTCFTSSGICTVGLSKWKMSAGVKTQYVQEADKRTTKESKEEHYQNRLARTFKQRKVSEPFTRVVSVFLNPSSECYMDLDKSIKTCLKWVKSTDRLKILETEQFRKAFYSMIKSLYPDLATAIKKAMPAEDMAEFLKSAMNISIDNKNVADILKVFDKASDIGYKEDVNFNYQAPVLPNPSAQLQVGEYDVLPEKSETETSDKPTQEFLDEQKVKQNYPEEFIMEDSAPVINTEDYFDEPES